jgi:hypothetical protein
MKTNLHLRSYLAQFYLEWKIFRTKVVEKLETYILCSVTFFENRAEYEIMLKNIVEPDRPQMTIWRKSIACWITKATNKHSEYVIRIAFLQQQWLNKRASILRYMYIACLFISCCEWLQDSFVRTTRFNRHLSVCMQTPVRGTRSGYSYHL